MTPNQNPEQIVPDPIDAQLRASGWAVQAKDAINFHEAEGQAVREYTTDTGPADCALFINGQPVGDTEAKQETLGANLTAVVDQTAEYASAKLRYLQSTGIPLLYLYEATSDIIRFTDQRDPKPRSREVFAFPRPETLRETLASPVRGRPARSFRARFHDLPALDLTHLRPPAGRAGHLRSPQAPHLRQDRVPRRRHHQHRSRRVRRRKHLLQKGLLRHYEGRQTHHLRPRRQQAAPR